MSVCACVLTLALASLDASASAAMALCSCVGSRTSLLQIQNESCRCEMDAVLYHDSALQGYTEERKTEANEMNYWY